MHNALIHLGYITKPFGLKGGLSLKLFNEHSRTLRPSITVNLGLKEDLFKEIIVEDVLLGHRIFFQGIKSKEQASELVGAKLFINKDLLEPLAKDEFYLNEFIGANTFDVNGLLLGVVVGFSSNNAQTLLIIKMSSEKEVLVPFIKPIVKDVCHITKKLIIDAPSGLFDI